jgi:hypothetical protein
VKPLVRQFALGVVFGLAVWTLLYSWHTDDLGLEAYIARIRHYWLDPRDPLNLLGYVFFFFIAASSFGFAYTEWGAAERKARKRNTL